MNKHLQRSIQNDRRSLQNLSRQLTVDVDNLDLTIEEAKNLTNKHNRFVLLNRKLIEKPYSLNPMVAMLLFFLALITVWAFDFFVVSNLIDGLFAREYHLFIRLLFAGGIIVSYIFCSVSIFTQQRNYEMELENSPISVQLEARPNGSITVYRIVMGVIIVVLISIAALGVVASSEVYDQILLVGYSILLFVMLLPHILLAFGASSLIEPLHKWVHHVKIYGFERKKRSIHKKFNTLKSTIDRIGRVFADTFDRHRENIEIIQNGQRLDRQHNALRPNEYVLGKIQGIAQDLSFGVPTIPLPKDIFSGWNDWTDDSQKSTNKTTPPVDNNINIEPENELGEFTPNNGDLSDNADQEDDDINIFQDENRTL